MARTEPARNRPRARLAVATGLGLGYVPVAPGTLGSLVGVALVAILAPLAGEVGVVGGWIVVTLAGWASAGAAERHLGRTDPGAVVVDEVSGQMTALLFLPADLLTLGLGFLLFRALDITKPPPARRLESLSGASGIMADDLVAGVYANLIHVAIRWVSAGS